MYQTPLFGTLEKLSVLNAERCRVAFGHDVSEWSSEKWALAVAGETGEMCNALKKVIRGDKDATITDVAKEMADIVIYLDLLATNLNIDLCEVVRSKFNEVSDRRGVTIKF